MSNRSEYFVRLYINGRILNRVLIDQHYRKNHADSIDDHLILDLIARLDGHTFDVEDEHGEFQYFVAEPVIRNGKPYRLILMTCTSDDFLGVINAFRIRRR